MMKKISFVIILVLMLCGCQNVKVVDYGNSKLYQQSELKEAVKIIKKEFKDYKGCTMHKITYLGDQKSKKELKYCQSYNSKYQEVVVFSSSFHTSKDDQNGFNPNEEVTDWKWILARVPHGKWKLITCGFA